MTKLLLFAVLAVAIALVGAQITPGPPMPMGPNIVMLMNRAKAMANRVRRGNITPYATAYGRNVNLIAPSKRSMDRSKRSAVVDELCMPGMGMYGMGMPGMGMGMGGMGMGMPGMGMGYGMGGMGMMGMYDPFTMALMGWPYFW